MHVGYNPGIRTRYRIAISIWLTGGSILLLGSLYVTRYLIVPLLMLFGVIGTYALSLKCPNCGKRVLYNPVRLFGKEFYIWTSWIPKECTRCGTDL